MKYVRLDQQGIALETFTPPDGVSIDECFHPTIVQQFRKCPNATVQGSKLNPDGTWTHPAPVAPQSAQ